MFKYDFTIFINFSTEIISLKRTKTNKSAEDF